MRKATNDKAREDHVIDRKYKRKTVERRKSWLRFVLKIHTGNHNKESSLEIQILGENKSQRKNLSPLKPQRLNFGPTSGISRVQVVKKSASPFSNS